MKKNHYKLLQEKYISEINTDADRFEFAGESDKEDVLSGLEELGHSLNQDLIANGYRQSYRSESVIYYTKRLQVSEPVPFSSKLNIVAYEPGTRFWPVTGPVQVDYNKTRYFAKIELSPLEYKTLMEIKSAADIKLAEQKAKDLWDGKYTTPIQENDKEDILAGLDELSKYLPYFYTMLQAVSVSFEMFLEKTIEFAHVVNKIQSKNFEEGVRLKKDIREYIKEHYRIPHLDYLFNSTFALAQALEKIPAKDRRLARTKNYIKNLEYSARYYYENLRYSGVDLQENKTLKENDKEDILAGLDELNVDPNEPVNQKSIRKLGFEEIPRAVFNNYFHIPEDKDLHITLAFIQSEPHSKVVLYPGKWYVWGENTRLHPVSTLGELQKAYKTLKTKIQQRA
jgi:hypothetical protein